MMESLSSLSSHAARRLVWVAFVTSLVVTIGGSRPRADNTFIPPLAAQGHQPRRGTFGLLPWERIDMASGNGVLSFTDLTLPGDAGFDLRFQRVLNLNDLSWHMGVPGPSQLVLTHGLTHQNPTIISMDGAEEYTFQSATGSDQYRTLAYGRLTKSTRTLELPNGLVYHFDHYVTGDIWDVTEVTDQYGNTLSFSYADGVTTIVQSVSGSSRVVVYDGNTKTLSWNGLTWVYQSDSNGLTAVVPPAGPPWQFSYGTYPAGTSPITYGRRISVTTANGGKVQYDVESQAGPGSPDPTYWHWVVRTRRSWDRGGATLGTWTFDYAADGSISSVSGPDGISHHYAHTQTDGPGEGGVYASRVFLTGHQVRQNGATLETTTLTWRWADTDEVGLPLDISPDGTPSSTFTEAAQPVLPREVSVTRAGSSSSWTTTYIYSETDGELNDYGQPRQIDETGDFSRSTARTFWSSDAPYIGGVVETETIGNAFETVYDRNGQGFVTSRTVYGVPTAYTSDAHGNVASETDANGHRTTYDYSWGEVSGVHAPEHTALREINPGGTVHWERRGLYQREFEYDELGRETNHGLRDLANGSAFIGNDTATSYAPDGSSVHSSRGASWTTTFLDGFGRPVGTENAVGVKTRLAYTAWGDRSYEGYPYDAADRGTVIAYDGLGRAVRRTNPDETFIGYDYGGLTTTITDEKGHTSTQLWKATGHPSRARLVEVVDADQQHTTYGYDIVDTLTGVTHPDGNSRSWSFNAQHRLVNETHPESGGVTYTYDAAGNVRTRTDANGTVLTYSYDGDDRLIGTDAPGTAYDATIHYDDWGNRYFIGNAHVTRDFAFKADRLTQVVDHVRASEGNPWATYTTTYVYDGNDNLAAVTYPAGPHRTVRYTYDAGNRITRVYEDGGPTYADGFTYHPSGAVAGYTSGNGVVNTLDYGDSHQRYWPHQISAGSVLSLTYGYDDVGNVQSINGAVSGNQGFGYDALDRLTSATGPWGMVGYGYDSVGNRIWEDHAGVRSDNTYIGNQLTASSGTHVETFTYDNAARLVGDGLGTYSYTPFDMLEQAAMVSGVTATYRYDGDQRRTASLISGVARYYLHGPGQVLLAEVKNEGGVESWVRDYIYAGTRLLASARDAHVTVTVDKFQRNGRGTVTSEPAGIACGATCTTARGCSAWACR